jgi:hypothetical protein
MMRAPGDVVRIYGGDAILASDLQPPANLSFTSRYRAAIEKMLQRSQMFRRQCVRIANAPHATVVIRNLQVPAFDGPRARTSMTWLEDGRLIATVEIRPLDNVVELLAHELEHVIEQLDGVDLPVRAALSSTGVHACDDGSFETIRAVRVGQIVARETRGGG